ncbi:MAG: tetratricopeptide repeat protein [Owenweeksia sp.]
MENSLRSVLEITARWSRYSFFLLFTLLVSSAAFSQEEEAGTEPSLSEKQLRKFNELFFMAEKEKNLGNLKEALVIYEQLYRMTTFNATVCYELGRIYAEQGERDDALFYAERAVELDPENKWFMLASIYREFEMPEKEVAIFKQLAAKVPDNPDYRYELAISYLNAGKPEKAIDELNELEKIIGINEVITDQKKQIYLEMGDLKGAAEEVERLIEAFPREMDYYGTLGQMYQINGYEEKAFEIYQKMLEMAPNDPRPHLDLAEYYRQTGDTKKSIFHLKKAMSSPYLDIDKKVPVLLSLYTASEKDTSLKKEAFIMLEDVIRTNPSDPKAYAVYGDFLSRDGRSDEALVAYKKAVRLEGGNKFEIWDQILLIEIQTEQYDSLAVDGPKAVDLFPNQPLPYFFTGVAFNVLKNYDESIFYLEEGLNYVIGNPRLKEQFFTQLADVYHKLKLHSKSDNYFEKALALNGANPTALNNYAYYLSVRGEKLDRALTMTEKSNRLMPGNATFMDTWAWVLYQRGDYKEALSKMEEVIKLGGDEFGEVMEHYGDILLKNNLKSEALEAYQKAKALGGTTPEIDEKIKKLSAP